MKSYKVFALAAVLAASNVYAQDAEKGLLFKIGEFIMGLGGHSYLELEQKRLEQDKVIGNCMSEVGKITLDLKSCKEAGAAPTPETSPTP